MNIDDASQSNYLKQDDLPDPPGSVNATIEDVRMETMINDGTSEPVAYFSNGVKPMVLNITNREFIKQVYGKHTETWVGKTINIYRDPRVMYAGKMTGGIRVRIQQDAVPVVWDWAKALAACGAAGVDKEQLTAAIKSSGGQGWMATRDTPVAQRLIAAASPPMSQMAAEPGHEPVPESEIPFGWLVSAGLIGVLVNAQDVFQTMC